jgi:hypothetical protein
LEIVLEMRYYKDIIVIAKTYVMKTIYLMLLALGTFSYCQAQKKPLSLNLETGKTYRQVTVSSSTIEQELGGQKMTITIDMNTSISYLVKGIAGDVYDMEMRYDSLKMSMNTGAGPMAFNSQKKAIEETDYSSKMLKEFVNKPIRIKMTRTGKIKNVENLDSMMNASYNKLTMLNAEEMEQIKSQMGKSFGGESFRNNFEMSSAIYPAVPVEKGDTWSTSSMMTVIMSMIMNTRYKYESKTPDYILISGVTNITSDKDKSAEMGNISLKYDLKGIMLSNIKVDPVSGWVIEATIDQNLEGSMIMKSPNLPDEMVLPIKMKTKTTTHNK